MTQFPVFRKFPNNEAFFIIHNERSFTEWKPLGKKMLRFDFEAKTYFDIRLIADMIGMDQGRWVEWDGNLKFD
ncbi:MAG: hypothetical protein Kow0075_00890 [Salibacteraceae bacterium]